jgi:hypothetical protein
MTGTTLPVSSPAVASPEVAMRWTQASIADLSHGQVHALATPELIAVIRAVDYPFAGKERLEFFDRDTLERVVHLVRRWCIHRRDSGAELAAPNVRDPQTVFN